MKGQHAKLHSTFLHLLQPSTPPQAGRCALVSDTFLSNAADSLSVPDNIEGNQAPPQGQEQRICDATTFK